MNKDNTKLTILNLIEVFFTLFFTLKLYHCAYPDELISFCKIKSYYLSPV